MAYDPESGCSSTRSAAANDLADRRLRAVGRAEDRFREDPLRILRAARLVATLKLEVTPEIESEMARARAELPQRRPRADSQRARAACCWPRMPRRGLALLRRDGDRGRSRAGTARDAAAVVGALPGDLELRLAGWLRGTNAEAILRRLRFSRRTSRSG